MACSKYQYVRKFENHSQLLPDTFIMVRIDGKGFTKFCQKHKFKKPNDLRAINVMNDAAKVVMEKFQEIFLAYGQSDEYSFAFIQKAQLFNRRQAKILSCIVSMFSSAYVMSWNKHFDIPLKQIPSFDGRCVCYPHLGALKDYFRWRQVDCHINNLYNTVFWCLVKQGRSNTEVEQMLKITNSGDKNEILFRDFGINYNNIEEIYRKGSIFCYWKQLKQKESNNNLKAKDARQSQIENLKLQKMIISQQNQKEQDPEICQKQEQKRVQTKQEDCLLKNENDNCQKPLSPERVEQSKTQDKIRVKKDKNKYKLQLIHVDIIKDSFWENIKI